MANLKSSIENLENYSFNLPSKIYLDPENERIIVSVSSEGHPEPAYHDRWCLLCQVPEKAIPSSVKDQLLQYISEIESLVEGYLGSEWNGNNWIGKWNINRCEILEEFELEFKTYWSPSEWYEPLYNDIIKLFHSGMSPEEIADHYGYSDDVAEVDPNDCIEYLTNILNDLLNDFEPIDAIKYQNKKFLP